MLKALYGTQEILDNLPHRYPFLLVDRVVSLEPWREIAAYKNVTFNEPFFQGHFPGQPVMPGVLILESMAQAAFLLLALSQKHFPERIPQDLKIEEFKGRIGYFASADRVKFRRMVEPGDRLDLNISFLRLGTKAFKVAGEAKVFDQKAAEAEMTATF
ncbi:MAG: 3-hydroxyacyl-ACP dehydratase FabZ [Deltaproteobacteria bacterium]|jgi:3-hydroxyacyl-[acyl-carrier-protein] dehydratase|nr:3-hydroxyacyl-ACP dehydratase FabZ [Deltaproteobacteria bacterium]